MKSRNTRALRIVFAALAVGMSMAFFAAFVHHVYRLDFKPMTALGVPILVVLFGFASLFFIRGRSLAKGSAQFRSLFAAERAVQAALWYLSGIMLGTVLYALLMRSGGGAESERPLAVRPVGAAFPGASRADADGAPDLRARRPGGGTATVPPSRSVRAPAPRRAFVTAPAYLISVMV